MWLAASQRKDEHLHARHAHMHASDARHSHTHARSPQMLAICSFCACVLVKQCISKASQLSTHECSPEMLGICRQARHMQASSAYAGMLGICRPARMHASPHRHTLQPDTTRKSIKRKTQIYPPPKKKKRMARNNPSCTCARDNPSYICAHKRTEASLHYIPLALLSK